MKEIRCVECDKLLLKEKTKGVIEIKCTRCNEINVIKN